MTLNELLEELQDIVANDDEAGEAEVRIAYQPNYPLAAEVDAITLETQRHDEKNKRGASDFVLWLAAGSISAYRENPYAPSLAWEGGEVDSNDDSNDD